MKIQRLIMCAGAVALLPLLAHAIPADPTPRVYTQPDGSQITLTLHGDAFFHYYADENNNIVDYSDGRFVVSNIKATTNNIERLRMSTATRNLETRVDVAADGRSPFPTNTTDIRGLVVLMQFKDTKFSVPEISNAIDNLCNQENYSDYNSKGSVRDYYKYMSQGKFIPTFDVAPMVTLSKDVAYYAGDNGWARFNEAATEAVDILFESGFDFSKYDYDNNGEIDNVFFFFAGYGKADSNKAGTIWPHKSTFYPKIVRGGKTFNTYACGMELKYRIPSGQKQPYLDGIGTFTHEFCHVLGFADHYDPNYGGTDEPSSMDLMSTGCYNDYGTRPPMFSAYEQWYCRWIEYDEITEPGHYVLDPLETSYKAYRLSVNNNENEYFLIESRADNAHWDGALPDHGCTFWHVDFDYNSWVNNGINVYGRSRLNIIRPVPEIEDEWCYGSRYHYNYPGFTGELKAVTKNNDFKAYITNIEYDKETGCVEFDYNLVTEQNDFITVLHEHPVCDANSRSVKLTWDAHPDADNYAITVYYTNSSGNTMYVKNCRELIVGNVTEYSLDDLDSQAWRNELHATVRVVSGLPSTRVSNELVFVPKTESAGVESIYGDETAEEWFTIDGLRINPDEARNGQLYIVRLGSKAIKVIK